MGIVTQETDATLSNRCRLSARQSLQPSQNCMNANSGQLSRRRLRAPQEDRAALIEPPLEQVADLVERNRRNRDQHDCDFHGRSLAEIARLARAELHAATQRWTAEYRSVPSEPHDPAGPIYLAGHQPQMFHPGVWFKNFALGHLARRHGTTAVNLIVDNDTLSDVSLRVPGGSASEPRALQIAFDRPDPKIPYEERTIQDRELFAGFQQRVLEQIGPLVADPLITQYWPLVRARAEHTDNLGACLAQARHELEGRWGLETLEVPQSRVCATESFQWLTAHLLARLPEFRLTHNEAVRQYRRVHRIRSVSHPVPELAEQGPWLEAPFWVWTADQPRRRRLFARVAGDEIILSDGQVWEIRLPLQADGDAGRAVQRLLELQHEGVRIRSRALITTLWARLALGDLFIHGIGGAKYDQVTDVLIERFFRLDPPRILVVSATLHLPIERPGISTDDIRVATRELRELEHHPERYLGGVEGVPVDLILAKRRWIDTPQTRENAQERCHAIRAVNAALQPWLDPRRGRLLERQAQAIRRLQAEEVLASREYAFCLYPEPTLREFLRQLLHKIA